MRKKTLAFVLAVVFMFSCIPTAFAANFTRIQVSAGSSGNTKQIFKVTNSNEKQSIILTGKDTIGIYFKTTDQLQGVTVNCPSMGNNLGSITLKLYKWKSSYVNSVKGELINEVKFTDFKDCADLTIMPPTGKTYKGEFLLTITGDDRDTVGLWKPANQNVAYTSDVPYKTFFNGLDYNTPICASISVISTEIDPNAVKINAYDKIYVDKVSSMTNGMKIVQTASPEGDGTTIPFVDVAKWSYMKFENVDFGDVSPKGVEFLVYNKGGDRCMIKTQVVLDTPNGYPVATFNIFKDSVHLDWETVSAKLTEEVTGVHDVYIISNRNQWGYSCFNFTKETPEKGQMEKIMDDYLATPAIEPINMYNDTWVTSDMVGRKLSDNSQVGDRREGRYAGMFFHTWRSSYSQSSVYQPYDTTKLLNRYDGDPKDIKNDLDYPYWCPLNHAQFWNESIYGYYSGFDKWTFRKQFELLSAIDIDTVFLDGTNNVWTYISGYMDIAKIAHEMNVEGYDAPKITFMGRFTSVRETADQIREFYENVHSQGLYEDTWFYFKGKPLMLINAAILNTNTGFEDIDKQNKEMLDFYTIRSVNGAFRGHVPQPNQWGWMDEYPQKLYNTSASGQVEQITVSPAQNLNDECGDDGLSAGMNAEGIYSRSYTYKNKHSQLTDTSYIYGYNYQEQWSRVHDIDPEIVFITGWNESYAMRFKEHLGVTNALIDSFDTEHSRDLEPIKGEHKDTYYLLTAENIRKYKGVQKTPEAGPKQTINLNGDFSQWNSVTPTYYDYTGLPDRNDLAYGASFTYTNFTGRNDFKFAKVSRDDENFYFYVETVDNITPYTDNAWMRLFLNTDRLYATGWEGYDYALNIEPASPTTLVLSKSTGFWEWEKVADVEYKVSGNKMMVTIPRSLVGLKDTANLDFEFKWADNMQTLGNLIIDFYTNGDAAPVGRFNYRYVEDTSKVDLKAIEENIEFTFNPQDKIRHFTILKVGTPYAVTDEGTVAIDANNPEVTPIIKNGRTFVPLRFVTERLGAQSIEWDEAAKCAVISYAQLRIRVTEGSKYIRTLDGRIEMDVAAFTMNDRLYIPLRAVSEAFGNVWIYWQDPCYVFIGDKYTEQYMKDPEVKRIAEKYFQ